MIKNREPRDLFTDFREAVITAVEQGKPTTLALDFEGDCLVVVNVKRVKDREQFLNEKGVERIGDTFREVPSA